MEWKRPPNTCADKLKGLSHLKVPQKDNFLKEYKLKNNNGE